MRSFTGLFFVFTFLWLVKVVIKWYINLPDALQQPQRSWGTFYWMEKILFGSTHKKLFEVTICYSKLSWLIVFYFFHDSLDILWYLFSLYQLNVSLSVNSTVHKTVFIMNWCLASTLKFFSVLFILYNHYVYLKWRNYFFSKAKNLLFIQKLTQKLSFH